MSKLTSNDIGILIEALDAWVVKDNAGELMGSLFTAILVGRDPEAKAMGQQVEMDARQKAKQEREARGEIATLLKATLIRMRRDLQSEEYAEGRTP